MLKKFIEKGKVQNTEAAELIKEIKNCEFLMARNETLFNMTSDEDLIESQIYEREALRYQYSYLIKQLKEKETEKTVYQPEVKMGEY